MAFWFMIASLVVPWVVAAWFLSRPINESPDPDQRRAQWSMVGVIAVIAAASILFRAMAGTRLQQTAALFVGIPTILAMGAVWVPTRSSVGVACKAVTIGLLISLIFLGEGVLCVLMSAPLFYLVAIIIGMLNDFQRRRQGPTKIFSCIALLAFVPMSFEGVSPMTSFTRDNTVSVTSIVTGSADAVAAAVVQPPRFTRAVPTLLTIGFPQPISTQMDGQTLQILMRGGEMRLDGMEPRAGTLVLEREYPTASSVAWRAVSDDSHMRHFLSWQSSEVEWEAVDEHRTRVTWTIRYRRDLDPAWYFGPMERFAVRLAARYLIESVATP